jgi:hypothetical protein
MGTKKTETLNEKLVEKILSAATSHAEETGEPDHEVGDLQDALRLAFSNMTTLQAQKAFEEYFLDHEDFSL